MKTRFLSLGALAIALASPAALAAPAKPATGEAKPALPRTEGFIPYTWDAAKGRVLMEVPAFDQDILYYVSAATNPGSVEAPFDRGIAYSAVIHFERSGGKVVVNRINTKFRATQDSAKTQEGVADSFPTSVLAVLPVESESGGKVTVDATALFMRDAAGIASQFKRDAAGSAIAAVTPDPGVFTMR